MIAALPASAAAVALQVTPTARNTAASAAVRDVAPWAAQAPTCGDSTAAPSWTWDMVVPGENGPSGTYSLSLIHI